nr:hypothetical protein [Tanacetum cinerariifolium]
MSSPDHSTSNIEDAFSSNFPDYTTASTGNISPDPPDNLSKYLFALPAISPFHNVQAYNDANKPPISLQVPITPPAILPLSLVLLQSPLSDSQDLFPSEEISPKDTKTFVSPSSSVRSSSPIRSTISPLYYPFNESIFAELNNSLWIIPRPLGEEPVPEELNESDTCRNDHLWK